MSKTSKVAATATETNVATETPTATVEVAQTPAEVTSDKLTEIQATIDAQYDKLTDRTLDRTARTAIMTEIFKLQAAQTAEINQIKKAAKEAEVKELLNARIAMLQNVVDLAIDNERTHMSSESTLDEKNATYGKFKAAFDNVANELTARYASSSPAKTSSNGAAKNTGAETSDILTEHLKNVAAGKTDSESRKMLEAAGHARSTVWHTVNNYNKAK